jgi:hypothetical protein
LTLHFLESHWSIAVRCNSFGLCMYTTWRNTRASAGEIADCRHISFKLYTDIQCNHHEQWALLRGRKCQIKRVDLTFSYRDWEEKFWWEINVTKCYMSHWWEDCVIAGNLIKYQDKFKSTSTHSTFSMLKRTLNKN